MTDPTNDNDIDALLDYLGLIAIPEAPRYHRALTALVAERDALRQRVAELEARSKPVYFAHGQRLESIDLRERLVESALQGAARDAHMHHEASSMGTRAVYIVDAAIAAMRKGEARE